MKKLLGLLFLVPLFALAQNTKVITHTVAAKESFTSIGRDYNINGRELANYNKLDYDKGLSIGQVLKIPVSGIVVVPPPVVKASVKTEPVVKAAPANNTETGAPVYHVVGKKETLYHISTIYNKVPIADLKRWNNLTGDGVAEGTKLIVGFNGKGTKTSTETVPPTVVKTEVPKETPPVKEIVKDNPPVKDIVKETPPPVVTGKNFDGGVFKNDFSKSGQPTEETGTGGVFKSTSGWSDGKYYCLHNSALPNSIIKITNTTSGKSIYAKVLDVMPDIKQNNGLAVLISNAAANELGVGETNFNCTVSYSKK